MEPAEDFPEGAGRFGEAVHGVPADGWNAPSPVEGWVARGWFPGFVAGGSDVELPPRGSVDDDPLRSSGQFGPRVPVPDDGHPQTRLLGFIGSDPHWRP